MAVGAVLAAVAAVWVTLDADFLANPGWLAAQKADFILGPVFVGLYWRRVRPESRFGPLLIGFGAVGAVYIVQSSSNPWLFATGLQWENAIYLVTLFLILTFPTGRLDSLAAKLILLSAVVAVLPYTVATLLVPQLGADNSISGCRALCPHNALAITSQPSLAIDLIRYTRVATIAVALATGGLLVWRMVTGTPPQRRALAIGAPIALLFTLLQITYQSLKLVAPNSTALHSVVQWALAGARSLVWYGFLFALIAAQLFAGRALRRLVRQSLRRPTQRELEAMLREPLGDPELRLAFRDPRTRVWPDAAIDGVASGLPEPEPGREVTVVERDGEPAVAILHDQQLADDPELLQAAGAVALLAAENAELDAAWQDGLRELRESRTRIVVAGDEERRKVERNLHDGTQQRLVAVRINLGVARELAEDGSVLARELEGIGDSVVAAIAELREVAHGLYPTVLTDDGLVAALDQISRQAASAVAIEGDGVGRHPADLESAVYYCCLEAIQNATKHGGTGVQIFVALREDQDKLSFEVTDDGPGFDPSEADGGTGLQNMRDRVGALDGRLSIVTAAGHNTVVSGSVPLRRNQDRGRAPVLVPIPDDRGGEHAAPA